MTELTRLRAQIEAFAPYNEQEEADRRQMLADMDCFSDLLTRENATAHFTASCWTVNPDRTKVLMAYHNLYHSWAWLGGHADGEADLLSVALREANEESGVLAAPVSPDIFSLEILHVAPHVKRGKFVCWRPTTNPPSAASRMKTAPSAGFPHRTFCRPSPSLPCARSIRSSWKKPPGKPERQESAKQPPVVMPCMRMGGCILKEMPERMRMRT